MVSSEFRRTMATGNAKRVWKLYGLTSPDDLILEDLAFAMGVIVIEDQLDSADARLIRSGDKGLIRVRSDIRQLGRKRFAVAHDLGHWRLHETLSQIVACTSKEMAANYTGSQPEIEANWFAAELLMPQHLFGTAICGTTPTPDVINGLAGDFRTTRTASAVRYVELSSDYCAMVISEKGRIRWWRASRQFDNALWIPARAAVSPRTLAGKLTAGKLADGEVQPVSMSEWAERYPEYAAEAVEAAIPLGQTGAILTTLWLE